MSNDIILGIDFGTSNSCISYYNKNSKKIEIIPNNEGDTLSPTILYFCSDSNEILYGTVAYNLLKMSNNSSYLQNIISNIKRLIGIDYSTYDNDNNLKKCFVNNKIVNKNNEIFFEIIYNKKTCYFSVIDIVKLYINYLKIICKEFFSQNLDNFNCCISVPVYYNDLQRNILKNCFEELNINIIRILNEPTSAALTYIYTHSRKDEEYVLVIDCGGGTTDLTLLYLDHTNEIYEVKNTIGNNFLGGEDITNSLCSYIKQKYFSNQNINNKLNSKIYKSAEYIKKQLNLNNSLVTDCIDLGEKDIIISITYTEFKDIIKDFFIKMKNMIYYVLDSYMVNNYDFNFSCISEIILVGGSTKMIEFKNIFKEMFEKELTNHLIDPDHAISIGNTYQNCILSDVLEENQDILLLDIVPLSIGVETIGGLMSPIILKNTIIPVEKTKEFLNSSSYEDTIKINIYQGERKFIKDNYLLASFELKSEKFKDYDKGELKINITFKIDNNNILTINANTKINEELINNEIIISKEKINCSQSQIDINKLIEESENTKLIDSELANKTLLKLELYDLFKYYLSVFHDKKEEIFKERKSFENVLNTEFNNFFNNYYNIIINYTNYSYDDLLHYKKKFEKKFQSLLFDVENYECINSTIIE